MSAFIVSKAHIDAMIRAGLSVQSKQGHPLSWYPKPREIKRLDHARADEVGQMLLDECVKSVSHRYQDDDLANLPGPVNSYWLMPYEYPIFSGCIPTPVEALKLISCYEYQSCEQPEWPDSEAYKFCQSLRSAIISLLPGYEEAPWEWEDQPDQEKISR